MLATPMPDSLARSQPACPRCGVDLAPEIAGAVSLHRCARCGGAWLDAATFRAMCERDAAAASATPSTGAESPPAETRVRYLACPVCGDVMSRVNFARVSGVIVDVCRSHGVWFDPGELHAIRRFVRSSGLAEYGQCRALDPERERRRRIDPSSPLWTGGSGAVVGATADLVLGVLEALTLLLP